MPRDLSTRLLKIGRLSVIFEPRDVWAGVYLGPEAVFVAPIPWLPVRWERAHPSKRDLSTRLFKVGRLELICEPRDAWFGGYVAESATYICLIPCLPVRWARKRA